MQTVISTSAGIGVGIGIGIGIGNCIASMHVDMDADTGMDAIEVLFHRELFGGRHSRDSDGDGGGDGDGIQGEPGSGHGHGQWLELWVRAGQPRRWPAPGARGCEERHATLARLQEACRRDVGSLGDALCLAAQHISRVRVRRRGRRHETPSLSRSGAEAGPVDGVAPCTSTVASAVPAVAEEVAVAAAMAALAAGVCGLTNPSRFTCYANSVVQQLYMLPQLRTALMSVDTPVTVAEAEAEGEDEEAGCSAGSTSVLAAAQELMADMAFGDAGVCSCAALLACMAQCGRGGGRYDSASQQDASRFAVDLCSCLDEVAPCVGALLGGVLERTKVGADGVARSPKRLPFFTLPVECAGPTLEGMLAARSRPRVVQLAQAATVSYTGTGTKTGTNTAAGAGAETFTEVVASAPCHLLVHLKRFAYDCNARCTRKVHGVLRVPAHFDARLLLSGADDGSQPPQQQQYVLGGVVMHEGDASDGHYTSYVRDRGSVSAPAPACGKGSWYHIDDDQVSGVEAAAVLADASGIEHPTRSALLLVYDLVSMPGQQQQYQSPTPPQPQGVPAPMPVPEAVLMQRSGSGSVGARRLAVLAQTTATRNALAWGAAYGGASDELIPSLLQGLVASASHALSSRAALSVAPPPLAPSGANRTCCEEEALTDRVVAGALRLVVVLCKESESESESDRHSESVGVGSSPILDVATCATSAVDLLAACSAACSQCSVYGGGAGREAAAAAAAAPLLLTGVARLVARRGVWRRLQGVLPILLPPGTDDNNDGNDHDHDHDREHELEHMQGQFPWPCLHAVFASVLAEWVAASDSHSHSHSHSTDQPLRIIWAFGDAAAATASSGGGVKSRIDGVGGLLDCVFAHVHAACRRAEEEGVDAPVSCLLTLAALPRVWKQCPVSRPWFARSAVMGDTTTTTNNNNNNNGSSSSHCCSSSNAHALAVLVRTCFVDAAREVPLSKRVHDPGALMAVLAAMGQGGGQVAAALRASCYAYDSDDDDGDGSALLGRRVRIRWANGKWYCGVVVSFDGTRGARGKHRVRYDDGEEKAYDMWTKANWQILGEAEAEAGAEAGMD